MIRPDHIGTKAGGSRIGILLLTVLLLLGAASTAHAQDCSQFGGVLDGDDVPNPPSQLQIDVDCTIRDYPASNPISTNFSFFSNPGGEDNQFLVIFDNVVHTGNMSCNATHEHKIWFTNGSSSKIKQNCQNLLIPVEKIDKQNPAGQTTAAIGVPFTYSLTIPVLFDPATDSVINDAGSVNELHSIFITDDLNETGVDLTYLSHEVYWKDSLAPVSHSFSNVGGLLTFDVDPVIPAGDQMIIEITVVLEDTPANTPGTQFINTARWQFGRLIDGVPYEPLPGENGITEPLTIAAPDLVVTKTGPATLGLTLNLGQFGEFSIDVHNTGLSDAWDVTIVDQLPDGAAGGMCDFTPEVLSAQVFEADGTTPASAVLVEGTDFSLAYADAPTCELTLTMLTPEAVIGPDQHLIITYRSKLDSDTQEGSTLTNVVGATEWFNGDASNPDRLAFTRTLTDGTVGVDDHEDAHTVTAELYGYFFEKSVENLTTGVSPAAAAAPGDTLRYTLRLQATDAALNDLTFFDDLGDLNASPVFVPGSFTLVSTPAGTDSSNTDPNGGTDGEGILDIRNVDVPADSDVLVQFDITLDPTLADGTVVTNQADLLDTGVKIADSDDPNVNGQADPDVAGDEDPTRVVVSSAPVGPLVKANTQATAAVGEAFSYEITVPETPHPFPIYDVRITDDLTTSAADLRFQSVTKISGSEPWTPTNTGTDTSLVIEDPVIGIDIPAGEQITIEITVVLEDTPTNVPGLAFTNTASFLYNRVDGDTGTELPGDQDTTGPMTIVGPELTLTKTGPATMAVGTPETFILDVQNTGDGAAWNATLTDLLPDTASGGTCGTPPANLTAQVFEADGTTPVSGVLAEGPDYTIGFSGCLLTLSIASDQGTIGPDQRLIVTYEAELDPDTQNGATLTNVAGAVEWFSLDASSAERRTHSEVVTDGTVGTLDHEDAHTVTVALPDYRFEKTVVNVTSGADPATTAVPGDVLRYTLRLTNPSDVPLPDLAFIDDLGSLNASPVFEPGTLTLVTVPAGADSSGTDPSGGSNGTGLLDVRNLDLPGVGEIVIEFEVTLASPLADGTAVTNQTGLSLAGSPYALSDDPNVNGPADPFVDGDEDPTVVTVQLPPAGALVKDNTQATASVGESFSYQVTVPATPYPFDLHDVRITDDLTASAADLRFQSVTKIAGSEPWTPTNTGTDTSLVIEDTSIGIDIPAGEQVTVEITVVLEDTPANVAGLTFTNTADWTYNTIDGDDASQQAGDPDTTDPMTVVGPELTLTKTGPATMSVGTPEIFTLDVQNAGDGPAWNATLTDLLPDTASGGTCGTPPANLTARVFEADGTTPVSGVLAEGPDYTTSFSGCLLTLTITSDQGTIGPGQRLIVTYEAELDPGTQNGTTLTNVAGAIEWFSAEDTVAERRTYTETVTDGTVGTLDHEDAHTVGVALTSYLFEKTVANVTRGTDPATTAEPGDVLRYTLRLENTSDVPLPDVAFVDDLGSLNASPVFEPGTLTLVTVPAGADSSGTDPSGGSNGTGLLDVRNLDLPALGQIVIEFEITLASPLTSGTAVTNQTELLAGALAYAVSDDPNVNGPANPFVDGDEDPTVVTIQLPPAGALVKNNTQATASVGESFSYQITVPAAPYPFDLHDVRITDDLTASAADLRFQSVTKIAGSEPWTPTNTGTDTNLVIEDTSIGIDIPAGEQVTVEITVVLEDTPTNVVGLAFTNTADWTYNTIDDDDASQQPGGPDTTEPMTIVGPDLTLTKSGPATMTVGTPGTFTLDVQNAGDGPAWNATVTDLLPDTASGGTCGTAPAAVTAQVFEADGTTPVSGVLAPGTDYTTSFSGCLLTLTITSDQGTIGPGQRLIVGYEAELDADTQNGATLTNVAGAIEWFSADDTSPDRRTHSEVVTDGTVGTLDHEDAHTVTGALPDFLFEKTVMNVTTGEDPATSATPGDVLRYRLRLENVTDTALDDLVFLDDLGSLNASPVFEPGTLTLVTVPGGADTSGTDPSGGSNGTGLVDVRNLSLPGVGEIVIEFTITLASPLPDGTLVTNQSQLQVGGAPFADSDDPDVNGPADPFVDGDEDPTQVAIQSSPDFLVEKVSTDQSGDPAVLLAGDTLRYTITVKNVGTADAVDAVLRDAVPVNTQYVAGSTTLNGAPVPDGPSGTSPLANGIPIHAPEDPTPGAMRADASATPDNVATIVFDVVIDADVIDGTVISNQGFVSAIAGGVSDQPSDDPDTPVADDPTRDVVGNAPLLFAPKSVALAVGGDAGTPGIVDPGDVLHYTITVYNTAAVPATGVVLTDAVPANTTYVADSTTLNGLAVGQPDGGVSPLAAGIPISSSDLTPPLPGPGGGTLSPGESAVLEFDLQVDAGVASGTIISNQAVVGTNELPDLPTDGDGDPATGPEPTVVVVGAAQQLSITKDVTVVGGGAALPGSELEYVVRVTNIASVPASDVSITDDLDAPVPGQLAYVSGSATLDGTTAGVMVSGSVITADYSAANAGEPLEPGETTVLRFRAVLDAGLAIGTIVTNTGVVVWNDPQQSASASVSIEVGGQPGVGVLSGTLWHDADFDRALGGETPLQGWTVELLRNGQPVQSVLSAADGTYRIAGVEPNDVNGDAYALRFTAPGAGASTASLGLADSPFTNGPQEITDIVVSSAGSNLVDLNLPIDPNGVVYDAVDRDPVAGATVTLLDAGSQTALPAGCFDDPVQQGQVTLAGGHYKFDLNFSDPACPSGGSYLVAVTPPGGLTPGYSQLIPPTSDASTAPLAVPACPGSVDDAVPATGQHCESQVSELAPQPPADTRYHVHLTLDQSQVPGSSQIFNNHIPLDPVLQNVVAITKTAAKLEVSRGQLVPYEITVRNPLGGPLVVDVVDRFPPGFSYVQGSARIDDGTGVVQPQEPTPVGRELTWTDVSVPADGRARIALLLAVGAGVSEGEYVNRAQAFLPDTDPPQPLTGEAFATVRVVPDFTFDCTDVLGKVFADNDGDGAQGKGERGIAGVRLVTTRGLVATTDEHGRFHITCAVVPREDRGSNFVLKLDDRTLPSGYRMTTRQVQVKRATRGKALRFRFGASIRRVVGLDLADAVFEPGSTEVRPQWRPRIGLLIEQLEKKPAILRLSYVADLEDPDLVDERLETVKQKIRETWEEKDAYTLAIETEIFWRRGAPPAGSNGSGPLRSLLPSVDAGPPALGSDARGSARRSAGWSDPLRSLPSVDAGPPVVESEAGSSAEHHMSTEEPFTTWAVDPEVLESASGDRIEEREVLTEEAETVKLTDVVPPIRFESGVADIPPGTVEKLRKILDDMRHLENVRLHLVGHTDDQPLSENLARVYGDNVGLSRERAGEVAEFLQEALVLPPESISFEWAGASQPVATNATARGRSLNRRVEVEVWYDEIGEKLAKEEVVVPQEIKRVKVCRMETVCKLRYREGHRHRARVKNLIEPLHYGEGSVGVPEDFIRKVAQTLHNLRDKRNVTVKFIGHTDDAPLTGRAERIYGSHLALSKARARRVALAIQDALDLPTPAVASDGLGAKRPLASNETPRGRALNRRIEVEFWHDDPLQELPDGPQPCPDAADAELVTKVYDPPWGRLAPIAIDGGDPRIPAGYTQELLRALDEVSDETNPRLRFVGYTRNERLDRRTALVYGDDIGLSAARARRTMERIQDELGLSDAQVEHEGHGYVQSDDVVNAGFQQDGASHVAVQVVYDELAVLDDYEGVEATPITRELSPKHPLALNLMRITVDGEPIDDPGRSLADIQRCTDVALDRADIRFRFDGLEQVPRLSVTARPIAVSTPEDAVGASASSVRFRTYTNYGSFIERSEIRIFEQDQSVRSEPLAVVPVGGDGLAEWRPAAAEFTGPLRSLKYLLRAYDGEGRFDETSPQSLWMVHGDSGEGGDAPPAPRQPDPLLAGYGETGPLHRNIPLGNVGSVEVHGRGIPPQHGVWLAGSAVPVDEHGEFVAEVLLPPGMHTVEVAVLDEEGRGELFLRDLEFEKSDWFYVGLADLTVSADLGDDRPDELVGEDAPFDPDSNVDGRLAFYLRGEFGEDWKLTASADTREEPIEDLFSNFLDKSPEALFRRIDPDYHYPTFGDDGTVEETAPTSGKFYLELSQRENRALWGNFEVEYLDNELAQVDRGLYGGNLHYQTLSTTDFGEQRVALDGFAAEPGTVPSREEFRGTGGSLYYLRRQDILPGSERLRIEVRDKVSGIVTGVVHLRPAEDYDIDYLQGRVMLSEPIASTVSDDLLVRSEGLSGDDAFLVVQYEYTPGFDEVDALALGGRGHAWLGDWLKLGLTANRNDDDGSDSTLYGADVTLRASTESWLKVQAGRSDGLVSTSLFSDDGGFFFRGAGDAGLTDADAYAYRADVSVGISDFLDPAKGRLGLYAQRLEGGYSAPGMTALTDTDQFGGTFEMPLIAGLELTAKTDWRKEQDGLEQNAHEIDLGYALTSRWSLGAGVRHDFREDDSPLVPLTQDEGRRTDAVVQVGYDSKDRWRAYTFGQGTIEATGDREDNHRVGVGGAYLVSDRLAFDGEVSYGNLGPAVQIGTSFQETEETRRYLTYSYEDERAFDGVHQRRGKLITGLKSRLSDSSSVYLEDRYEHGEASTGLARAMGIDLAPSDRWSLGANWELGTLIDGRTNAETKRRAGGARLAYGTDALQLSTGIEYRFDDVEQLDGTWADRTTWLFRNNLRYQVTEGSRVTGKFNHSFSDSSLGEFFDGGFTELVLGYALRPVQHDRLHVLTKYTYFYNVPTTDQVTTLGTPVEFIQKSHVAALDVTYDLTASLSIGGKYAYRLGQVSLDREDPDFFDNNAHLYILRGDWRFLEDWETSLEGRMLDLPDLDERRIGGLVTLYRYLGDNFKVGVGYNFTDFSEDLTDLSYDHHGLFFNLVGTL